MSKLKFIFCMRPFSWFFRKDWYSLARWNKLYSQYNCIYFLIDIGAITIGFRIEWNEIN